MVIDIENIESADIYYAEGISKSLAKGKRVALPEAGLFKVKYPNSFYLTVLNKDKQKTPYGVVRMIYWFEKMEAAERYGDYKNDPDIIVGSREIKVSH